MTICARCIELFTRAQRQIESHQTIFEQNDFVLPTPLRMDADERFTGRGVTMAFLDSGFYAHPDLTKPRNRILAYHSLFATDGDDTSLHTADVASWHGMMTSVVAAGSGALSDGFYRGIASDADLVLVKIGLTGRISEDQIRRGLEWVLEHRERYKIRVVNISAGGDFEESYLTNELSQTVEECARAGLTVVCAVGNAGHMPGHPVLPPASAPSCIAVGGLDDQNSTDRARRGMYRSSYGPTIDGLQKPEVIAPGIWVAAPILPHTPTAEEAELYAQLDAASDEELPDLIAANRGVDKDLDQAASAAHTVVAAANHHQAARRQRHQPTLQVCRWNFVRRADRLVNYRVHAGSQSEADAAANQTNPHRHGRTSAGHRSRSAGLGRGKRAAGG